MPGSLLAGPPLCRRRFWCPPGGPARCASPSLCSCSAGACWCCCRARTSRWRTACAAATPGPNDGRSETRCGACARPFGCWFSPSLAAGPAWWPGGKRRSTGWTSSRQRSRPTLRVNLPCDRRFLSPPRIGRRSGGRSCGLLVGSLASFSESGRLRSARHSPCPAWATSPWAALQSWVAFALILQPRSAVRPSSCGEQGFSRRWPATRTRRPRCDGWHKSVFSSFAT